MIVGIRLLNAKDEDVVRAEIESANLANVNNIIYKGKHYSFSAISHRTNVITYRAVTAPVELLSLEGVEVRE